MKARHYGHGRFQPYTVDEHSHRFVHLLYDQMNERQLWEEDLAFDAGLDRSTLTRWRLGNYRSMRLDRIEAAMRVLGYGVHCLRDN